MVQWVYCLVSHKLMCYASGRSANHLRSHGPSQRGVLTEESAFAYGIWETRAVMVRTKGEAKKLSQVVLGM